MGCKCKCYACDGATIKAPGDWITIEPKEPDAVKTLRALLADTTPAFVRLKAAQTLLDHGIDRE